MAIFVQKKFTRESIKEPGYVEVDVFAPEYPGYVVLYAMFGLIDAIYQGFALLAYGVP